jgi:HK97 family phage portal protein
MHAYKRDGVNREKESPSHYAETLINLWGSPNDYTTAFDLWYDFYTDALLRGVGLLWIERVGATPVALHRLEPTAWRPVHVNGKRFWVNYGSPPIVLNEDDVIHHSGVRLDGLHPSSPVRKYADTFATGISLQKFASKFFDNGAHVGGILVVPPGANEDAVKNVTASVKLKENPENWFKTMVLRDGFNWQSTTSDPKNAQITELDETQARHVCRIFNIPPSRLGLRDSVAYNSLESEETRYFKSALGPHLRRVQSQCHRKLILPSQSDTHFIDYLVDALNWTDAKTKAAVAQQGIQAGWLDKDEVRRWHNLPARKIVEPTAIDSSIVDRLVAAAIAAANEQGGIDPAALSRMESAIRSAASSVTDTQSTANQSA